MYVYTYVCHLRVARDNAEDLAPYTSAFMCVRVCVHVCERDPVAYVYICVVL